MPKVYVHLSGRDVDCALLKMHGIQTVGNQENVAKLTRTICARCNLGNSPSDRFCGRCGLPLSIDAAVEMEKQRREADDLMSKLSEDAEGNWVQKALRKVCLQLFFLRLGQNTHFLC
jgi:integrase/recombinase XerD